MSMTCKAMTLAGAAMLASCTYPAAQSPEAPMDNASIAFAVSPCFGFCPDFAIEIGADGSGTYEGRNFVKTFGRHEFAVSAEEYGRFARRLAPFRPQGSVTYDWEHCDGPVATDSPSVNVNWNAGRGASDGGGDSLSWYMGCRQPGLADKSGEIYDAWEELPAVMSLVGAPEERSRATRP